MNQAGLENKCSKRVSNECILNNYNFDDVSTDQNNNCENCKQRGCSVCGKYSCHVGTVNNTEHVVEVAEVSQQQQQTGTNNSCHHSLLQKAWVYLQSVITTHMSGCPRCNPKPPPSSNIESPSQSSIVSFLSSLLSPSPSTSRLSCQQSCCMTSCHRGRSPCQAIQSCPRSSSSCCNARPNGPTDFSPCRRPTPPSSTVKPPSPKAKQTHPKPNAKPTSPDDKPTPPHAKPSYLNAECPNSKCPNAEPSCPNAIPPCPNAKYPNAKPSCPSLQPPCPHDKPTSSKDKPPCPYAKPPCPNAKCSNAKSSCPSLQPPCPHDKPTSSKDKPLCPYAKPPCPNAKCPSAKPSCPSLQPPCPKAKPSNTNLQPPCVKLPCPNSKTSLYHSFSNESLSSICKEALVELAKIHLEKMTSDHKIRCPRCSKRPTCSNSKETMTSYLRSIFDQAWSYFIKSTEQNTGCLPQRALSNCSKTSTRPRISESSTPTQSRCYCPGSQPKSPKTQSCESFGYAKLVSSRKSVTIPKPDTCPTCLKPTTCAKPATCSNIYKCEGTTLPAQRSEEEGTHEHKSCCTHSCMHNSQGVQPSFRMSDKSCWSPQTSAVNPLNIRSRQIKTPRSVEELKASITGVTCLNKSSGNMLGCEVMDAKDSICSADITPPKLGSSLTMEQKDHKFGSLPMDCKHLKESLDNCEETMSPCNVLVEQACMDEAPCSSSGGSAKSDEALLDKGLGSKPREQVHSKEKICKSGRNSVTCVDNNHPDRKDCNTPEIDAHRKDPCNYRYYY